MRLDIKAVERNDKGICLVGFDDDAIVCFVPVQCGTSRLPTRMMEPIRIAEYIQMFIALCPLLF